MMRGLAVIMLGLMAAGCGPLIKSSSPNHVIVESYQMNDAKVQQVAEAACARYHRRASVTLTPNPVEDEREYIFACND